jgi:hypothetical protein
LPEPFIDLLFTDPANAGEARECLVGQVWHQLLEAVINASWFPEADTNTVLLFLEREENAERREQNSVRFVRLRRPLAQLIALPGDPARRGAIEAFLEEMIDADIREHDPRMQINQVVQGREGGLTLSGPSDGLEMLDEDEE